MTLHRLEVVDIIYPVGSIYISVNSTNPSQLFGGTWERIKDKFLLANGDTYANNTTGGSATNTHQHYQTFSFDGDNGIYATKTPTRSRVETKNRGFMALSSSSSATREDSTYEETINIMPPYLTVYVWKRVADVLFEDACNSATGLTNYGSIIQVENSTSATMTYDSTMNAYLLSSTGNGVKIFPVNALDGLTQLKFSMELYVPQDANNTTSPSIEIATTNKTSVGYCLSTEANRLIRHRFVNGSWQENYNVSESNTIVKGEWCYYECSINGTSVTTNVYRSDKTTLIGTNTYTLTNNSSDYNNANNRRYGVGIGWSNGAYGYVRNIKAEPL